MGAKKHMSGTLVAHSLKDLKKIIKRKGPKPAPRPLNGVKKGPRNEDELFLETMKEVCEIKEFREMPLYRKRSVHRGRKPSVESEALRDLEGIVKGRLPLNLPDTPEYVEWVDQEYREDILKQLHEGRYAVQDCLDLHGIVLEEAEIEVERFLRESVKKGLRCIKIIHGRGLRSPKGPVLKTAVVKWLLSRFRKYIIGYATARQCDGGLGALYVLLK